MIILICNYSYDGHNMNNDNYEQIKNNIISTLIRIDTEAHDPNISSEKFSQYAFAIKKILNKVEIDFGSNYLKDIFISTTKQLGHSPGPLEPSMIQKLVSFGFKIKHANKIMKSVSYNKN